MDIFSDPDPQLGIFVVLPLGPHSIYYFLCRLHAEKSKENANDICHYIKTT